MSLIGILAFCFIGFTLINRALGGAFISSPEISSLNNLAIFREQTVGGLFTVPVLNLSYFTEGIPHLIKWDYSFFGGNAAIFQYFLYTLSAVVAFLLLSMVLGLAGQFINRVRN